MNNKKVSRETTSAIFLAIVLVAGTFALSSPSFMVGAAQAQPYYGMDKKYNDYESDYEMNSYDKKPYEQESYGKDKDKSKDSRSDLLKKLKCNNINANLNNVDANFGGPVEDDTNGAAEGGASEALAAQGSEAISANGLMNSASDGDRSFVDRENNFAFVCINNNNNTVIEAETPEPLTCEECFTSILTEEELNALIEATTLPDSLPELCNEFIEGGLQTEQGRIFISNYLFTSGMTAGISVDKINAILDCLEEIYGVDFPRP